MEMKGTSSKPSPLLQLPAELKIKIYKCLLISDFGQGMPGQSQPDDQSFTTISDTSILATCKQVHAEARPIFYENNTFVFTLLPKDIPSYRIHGPSSRSAFRRMIVPEVYQDTFQTHPAALPNASLMRRISLAFELQHQDSLAANLDLEYQIGRQVERVATECPELAHLTINLIMIEEYVRPANRPVRDRVRAEEDVRTVLKGFMKRLKTLQFVFFGDGDWGPYLQSIAPPDKWQKMVHRGSKNRTQDAYFTWPGVIVLSSRQIDRMRVLNGLQISTTSPRRIVSMTRELQLAYDGPGSVSMTRELRLAYNGPGRRMRFKKEIWSFALKCEDLAETEG